MKIEVKFTADDKETDALLLISQENIDIMIDISEKIQHVKIITIF